MLEPILETTRARLGVLPPIAELVARSADAPPVRDLVAALAASGLGIIAEVKRRSPSRGPLALDLDPVERAGAYERGGAAAVSVLTEPDHFAGSDADLMAVRASVSLPVLRKDFTLTAAQIWEARAIGADAILLIVAALDDAILRSLLDTADEVGVAALVEVHDESEAERALQAGARIVGVNNRDLTTFHVDLATSERLAPILSGCEVTIAESGILKPADAARMAAAGYDAVLVGESLVRSGDPATALAALRT
ncbi:MAG: indole-3-glycerol phosphate synthase TrpC [Acidimicrobiia bacterium]